MRVPKTDAFLIIRPVSGKPLGTGDRLFGLSYERMEGKAVALLPRRHASETPQALPLWRAPDAVIPPTSSRRPGAD